MAFHPRGSRTFIGEVCLPQAAEFRRKIEPQEEIFDLLLVERGYTIGSATEKNLLDIPPPWPGGRKVESFLRPDNVAL